MRRLPTLFICFALFSGNQTIAQKTPKAPIKFGDVPIDQVKMTKYEKDSSASAVIIADYGVSAITWNQAEGFTLGFERLKRVKILTKEGLDQANFEIPLYHRGSDTEKVSGVKVVTYNLENGKIVETKIKPEAIFTEKLDENWDLVKGAPANVHEGSVVEISYKVRSDFFTHLDDWEFQGRIPSMWSEYRVSIPEYFSYDKYMQGYVPITVNEQTQKHSSYMVTNKERSGDRVTTTDYKTSNIDFTETNYRWAIGDIPAFKNEPYMTSYRDFVSKIRFDLSYVKFPDEPIKNFRGTWESLNADFLDNAYFGKLVSGSGFLNKSVEEAVTGITDPAAKVEAIYNLVKGSMVWNGQNRKYATVDNLKRPWEDKKGASSDINLILTSMLQKADIKADPVLISTRDNGFIREQMAVGNQFNYVICAVRLGDKVLLLDATEKTLPIHILPQRCLNGSGFVISGERSGWVKLAPNFKSRTATSIDLTLFPDGKLTGKVNLSQDGYFAQAARQSYVSKGGQEGYLKAVAEKYKWEEDKSSVDNIQQLAEPVKESHEVTMSEQTQSGGGIIYLNPILTERITENPFKSEKREYPVDFGSAHEELFMGKITLPEGYQVDELPKPKVLALPGGGGRYVYSVTLIGANVLAITSQLSINKGLFVQDEYPSLREFYNQVVAKQAEQIVVKKK